MLAEADASLIARDSSVSGLGLLLDDEALSVALQEALPRLNLIAAHAEYLRYKPGVSCLARIALQTPSGPTSVYAIAYQRNARDKLHKAEKVGDATDTTPVRLRDESIVVYPFPLDRRLPALRRFVNPRSLHELLQRSAPHLLDQAGNDPLRFSMLRYKPERRFVAQLSAAARPLAALKIYSATSYPLARRATKIICGGASGLSHAKCIGHSERHSTLLFQWVAGPPLSELATDAAQAGQLFAQAARVLQRLHARRAKKLRTEPATAGVRRLRDSESVLTWIDEQSVNEVRATCDLIAQRLLELDEHRPGAIHGDLHLKQFIVGADGPQLLDFDRARRADPAEDLGTLYAYLKRRSINSSGAEDFERPFDCFLREYASAGGEVEPERIHLYAAARLMQLAVEPFRNRYTDWFPQTRRFVEAAQQLLPAAGSGRPARPATPADRSPSASVEVDDPYDVAQDGRMPSLRDAIQPRNAELRLRDLVGDQNGLASLELDRIRVLRHKPARRCLIEYRFRRPASESHVTVLGKVHAKPRHAQSFARQQALWGAGFDTGCADGICVVRPLGIVPEWSMWLQSAVSGQVSWPALEGPQAPALARRIAEAAHKLHHAHVPANRTHTLCDELAVLSEHLPRVADELPEVRPRLHHLLEGCRELAETIDPVSPVGIHRDFYPDQVLIDGDRLFVVDHDLYASGDPRLDIGNFCGHLVERSIRLEGHPRLYDCAATAMIDRFVELAGGGEACRRAINVYAVLTLARHVFLSRRFPERQPTTVPLIELVEQLTGTAPLRNCTK